MEAAVSSTAVEQTPLLGDTNAKLASQKFILRAARISDLPIMAAHSKEAYWLSPVTRFLAPKAEEHPEDMVRTMLQGIRKRFVAANSLSLVACIPAQDGQDQDEKIVGYGQFSREGNDEGAKNFLRSKGWAVRIALWVLSWWFWACHLVTNAIWPDQIADKKAVETFGEWVKMDREKYWTSRPDRHD